MTEQGRLVMLRDGVHERLMEKKKAFEAVLGEEVSFDAFLLSVLEMLDKLEILKEQMIGTIRATRPTWVVDKAAPTWFSKTSDGHGNLLGNTVSVKKVDGDLTHCDTCGNPLSRRQSGMMCEGCGKYYIRSEKLKSADAIANFWYEVTGH